MSTFTQTKSAINFMKENGLTFLRVADNLTTGKQFGVDSNKGTYRLSAKVTEITKDNILDLSVSWFTPEKGDASWMIHPTGVSNVRIVSEFSLADLESEVGVF